MIFVTLQLAFDKERVGDETKKYDKNSLSDGIRRCT